MHDAIRTLLDQYNCKTRDDYVNALREIIQELALLGLWRSKFFEHAAFYGGTALRVLYRLDRFSENIDFSLLAPDPEFDLNRFGLALQREIASFGFSVEFEGRTSRSHSAVESAFLKTNTYQQLITVGAESGLLRELHPDTLLKIKLEVDTDPPDRFHTEHRYLYRPVPYAVRVYTLPDLFAGKLHAILCRKWKNRVKGRDWYDLAWYVRAHPAVRLAHLEARLRQSDHYSSGHSLGRDELLERLHAAVDDLNVEKVRQDVSPFVRDQSLLALWSRPFFHDVVSSIEPV